MAANSFALVANLAGDDHTVGRNSAVIVREGMRTIITVAALVASSPAFAGTTEPTVYSNVRQDFANAQDDLITARIIKTDLGLGSDEEPSYKPTEGYRVYVDPNTASNNKLLVFLPGCGMTPSDYTQFLMRAASHGTRVIGLMFWNSCNDSDAKSRCPIDYNATTSPTADECFTNLRHFQYNNQGPGLAPDFLTSGSTALNLRTEDSVRNRLRKLLRWLVVKFPNQGWEQFAPMNDTTFNTSPFVKWNLVTLAGHSEGTKVGAYIAAHEKLAKASFFSGPSEHVNLTPTTGTCPWISPSGYIPSSTHTDATDIYEFWSEHDDHATDNNGGTSDGNASNDVDACSARTLGAFATPNQSVPTSVDFYWYLPPHQFMGVAAPALGSGFHALYSTQLSPYCSGHDSTVVDCGQPSWSLWYGDVWDYLLSD